MSLMGVRRVEDLACWQLAMALHERVVIVVERGEGLRDPDFVAHLLDATEGGARNIAEGFARYYRRELRQFFRYAIASLVEAETQLHHAARRKMLDRDELQALLTLSRRATKATRSFMLRGPGPPGRL